MPAIAVSPLQDAHALLAAVVTAPQYSAAPVGRPARLDPIVLLSLPAVTVRAGPETDDDVRAVYESWQVPLRPALPLTPAACEERADDVIMCVHPCETALVSPLTAL
jgi:hypothetical protein